MKIIRLDGDVDLEGFRQVARAAAASGLNEGAIRFVTGGADEVSDLFAEPEAATAKPTSNEAIRVPPRFLAMADLVCRHREPTRYDLLYAALLRLRDTPRLLEIASDPLVRRLEDMERAVRRDQHKMTAFVRFREIEAPDGARFVAWFEPGHFIEELTAPFFVDRFASMRFAILTPRTSILWDGALRFGPGARREDMPPLDDFAGAWDVYYRSIFNPARLMTRAMLKEMPKKYWANLPETRQIPAMSSAARLREARMVAAPPSKADPGAARVAARFAEARKPTEPADAHEALLREAKDCRLCPLGDCATQIVFGEGPMQARAIFVGEQPGDQEDLQGRPFVGPAGALLRSALREAGFSETEVYLTNAVKHFKFVPRGKRRIHKTPSAREIDHCRWWLDRELALVEAPLIVTLGASALRAVAGPSARLSEMRGRPVALGARTLLPTVHPAYLLRLPDPAAKEAEARAFANDLKQAAIIALGNWRADEDRLAS
ncbi:MAG: UdgX family uracil-DNA binding protein [Hyphomicrobiales bacterium]|nr:UdgX family uracil-DNA binding protein [Hyphomicrobiales bacterium]